MKVAVTNFGYDSVFSLPLPPDFETTQKRYSLLACVAVVVVIGLSVSVGLPISSRCHVELENIFVITKVEK